MNTIEFEAQIENGVVHIPPEFKELQKTKKAKFIVIYDNTNSNNLKKDTKSQLEEFRRLRSQSNNKVTANMDLLKKLDEDIINDNIF